MPHDACSEGRLMALLDGELPESEVRDVRRHLDACWECRARLAELEADVHAVARAYRQATWYAPLQLEQSRKKLHRAMAAEQIPSRRPPLWRLAPFAAASLALASGVVWYATRPAPTAPERRSAAARPKVPETVSSVPAPAVARLAPPRPPVFAAAAPDITETLLDMHEALHRAGVCVRETAAVRIEDGRMSVRVLVAGAERRAEIETVVARPGVELDVTSSDEAAGPQEEVVFVPRSGAEVAGRRIPIHDEAAGRIKAGGEAGDREVKEFADLVLRASEALNLQHGALLKLAEAFPPEVEAKLSARGRERLRALVASHERQMEDAERLLRRTLRPLLNSAETQLHEASGSWQQEVRASRVPALHRAITRLFAVPLGEPAGEPASVAQLAPLLARPLTPGEAVLRSDLR